MGLTLPDLADDSVAVRAWSASDVDVLVRACNDVELRARVGVPAPYTVDDAVTYIELCAAGWAAGEQFTFAVTHKASGAPVGSVGVGPSPGGATAGYWTARWARQRGVASSALRMVTRWALDEGISPVRLYIAPDNIASQRVAAKASYRRDASDTIVDPEGVVGDFVFIADGIEE
jgi:RimJ/RimL family protein N-acetyltransferase